MPQPQKPLKRSKPTFGFIPGFRISCTKDQWARFLKKFDYQFKDEISNHEIGINCAKCGDSRYQVHDIRSNNLDLLIRVGTLIVGFEKWHKHAEIQRILDQLQSW